MTEQNERYRLNKTSDTLYTPYQMLYRLPVCLCYTRKIPGFGFFACFCRQLKLCCLLPAYHFTRTPSIPLTSCTYQNQPSSAPDGLLRLRETPCPDCTHVHSFDRLKRRSTLQSTQSPRRTRSEHPPPRTRTMQTAPCIPALPHFIPCMHLRTLADEGKGLQRNVQSSKFLKRLTLVSNICAS